MLKHVSEFPSFLRLNNISLYICTTFYPLFCWWTLGLLPPFGYCEYAAVNMGVQISVPVSTHSSWGQSRRSGIAGSYGNSMFHIFRNCQTVFYSSCTILHSHRPCTGFQFPPIGGGRSCSCFSVTEEGERGGEVKCTHTAHTQTRIRAQQPDSRASDVKVRGGTEAGRCGPGHCVWLQARATCLHSSCWKAS